MQIQEQSPISVLQKMCSAYMQQIYRKHPCRSVSSVKLQTNFIEITVPHGCFPVNLLHICRNAVLTNTYGELLLQICVPYFSIQIRVKFGLFSNIFLTSSMFSSEWAALRIPESSLFLFRLVSCEWYFVNFCWIVFLQGGAWVNRCWNAAWTTM